VSQIVYHLLYHTIPVSEF